MLSDKIESEKKRVYNLTFDFLSNNNNNNITKSRNLQQVANYTRYSLAIIRKEKKKKAQNVLIIKLLARNSRKIY